MQWYITNIKIPGYSNKKAYYTNIIQNKDKLGDSFYVHIDGYIVPRIEHYQKYKNFSQTGLIKKLYETYGNNFMSFIKGIFVIVILKKDSFLICTDRHSIKKYFIYQNNSGFYISNSLKLISNNFSLEIDFESAALFTLFSHFIDGYTLFKKIKYSLPGQYLIYCNKILREHFYWTPQDILMSRHVKNNSIDYLATEWQKIIKEYINYLKPGGISVTITGGNDSRMVLAAIPKKNLTVHTFTYGNPDSSDGITATEISEMLQVSHSNYYVNEPSEAWFEEHGKEIICYGNSLINIHRAHRHDAVRKEKMYCPNTDMVFTGLVGGEYLKEPRYDNIVLPHLFKIITSFSNQKKDLLILRKILSNKGIIVSRINVDIIQQRIKSYLGKTAGFSKKEKKFILSFLFYGSTHHIQDTNIYNQYFKYVVNPFMDIDFLELMVSDKNWYGNIQFSLFRRLFHSEQIVAITDYLSPELSDISYAKKGKYSANDLLKNKLKYIIKRSSYYLNFNKIKNPPNFPMGNWLFNFSISMLENFPSELIYIYDIDYLKKKIDHLKSKQSEEEWHVITNPLNLSMIYEYFKEK